MRRPAAPDRPGRLRAAGIRAGRFKVIRHVRPKLACVRCQGIFQASAPSRPIARGLPGPGAAGARDGGQVLRPPPLYRQSGIYAREGVDIDRSTLAGWVDQGDAACSTRWWRPGPLHAGQAPRSTPTTRRCRCCAPGAGKTKTGGCGSTCATTGPAAQQAAGRPGSSTRPTAGRTSAAHLRGYRGICRPTPTRAGAKLYASGRSPRQHAGRTRAALVGCVPGAKARPGDGGRQALQRIAALYEIEATSAARPPDVRRRERQARSRAAAEGLARLAEREAAHVSAKSDWRKRSATASRAGRR
jgi:transposase